MGLFLAWSAFRSKRWLVWTALLYAVGVSVFYLITRLKLPLVPLLLIFAVVGWPKLRDFPGFSMSRKISAIILAIVLAVVSFWPYTDRIASAYVNVGMILEQEGDNDAAIDNYRIALDRDPDYAMIYQRLALLLVRQDRLEEARSVTQLLAARVPHPPAGVVPKNGSIRLVLAQLFSLFEDVQESRLYFEEAYAAGVRDPSLFRSRIVFGLKFAKLGKDAEALKHFEWVWERSPRPDCARWMVTALFNLQRKEEAARILKQARVKFPEDTVLEQLERKMGIVSPP
jgi:tetratricopeptide (TPR) repeat protein